MAVQGMPQKEIASCNGALSRRADVPLGQSAETTEAASAHMLGLVRAVEGEIVPRLLLARRYAAHVPGSADADPVEAGDANELARLLLVHDVEVPFAYVESIRFRGVDTCHIYTRLLALAARKLGVMWEQEECDFLQVTMGLGRLQQLLHRIAMQSAPESLDARGHGRRALLATTPGENHSFGIMMVSEFFRRHGWDVDNEFPASEHDLAKCVRDQSFSLVGLSAGCDARIDSLTAAVRAVRRCSRNPAVGIIVGGPLFREHPEWAARVGADATAEDGEQAVRLAESVCALLADGR